ncbi:MAG: Lrp/AsnC family transcriptional regulator [Pseudomonadota bacterium]
MMDERDRRIINALHGGFPVCPRPYAKVAATLGLEEDELIARLEALVASGVLSRFGPLVDAERLGGAVTLAAMAVPEAEFETVAEIVNAFPEVAHNYARTHRLNMWFVVASEMPKRIAEVIAEIERVTGLKVHDLPKEEEYFLELRLSA